MRLGQFINQCSSTERILQRVICHCIGISEEAGRGLYRGGIRIADGIETLRAVLESQGRHRLLKLAERTLGQLATINSTRNNIVHWGSNPEIEDNFRITNKGIVHKASREQSYVITPDTLSAMHMDLLLIELRLLLYMDRHRLSLSTYRTLVKRAPLDAWQYKPPQPAPQKEGTRHKRRERQRQRRGPDGQSGGE